MSRTNRVKATKTAYYHVVSRIANKAFLLVDDKAKRVLLNILHRAAEFSGVDVATYVIMDNHFHLCIRVPENKNIVSEAEVIRRVAVLYGENYKNSFVNRLNDYKNANDMECAESMINKMRARMGDLSEFMKTFKQRFSQWYNRYSNHEGTLWAGRFKSALIEDGDNLNNVIGYIHSNPVRAQMVKTPEEYEWSALGAARNGDIFAAKGLSLLGYRYESDQRLYLVRNRRFENGGVIGSLEFVKNAINLNSSCFKRKLHKIVSYMLGPCVVYATHGQRSA
jgi:REP element-mobilizing transposase RayT